MQYEDSIKNWLYRRKINDATIAQFGLSCDDDKITIPIHAPDGTFLFNKYRRNPFLEPTGIKYWYDKGSPATLFGAHFIADKKTVVITEGELDALVLWSHNIPAVSSTSGARTFKDDWRELLEDKEIYICYDNDIAGGEGAVHTLGMFPAAKVILLPDAAGVKDISDYYERGGDLRNLMQAAKNYVSLEQVREERGARAGAWQSISFHDAWIRKYEAEERKRTWDDPKNEIKHDSPVDDYIARAKQVPIGSLIKVRGDGKAKCLFHNDKNPSMHVYPDNHIYCFSCGKRGDVIDIAMELQQLNFKDAVKWLNRQ